MLIIQNYQSKMSIGLWDLLQLRKLKPFIQTIFTNDSKILSISKMVDDDLNPWQILMVIDGFFVELQICTRSCNRVTANHKNLILKKYDLSCWNILRISLFLLNNASYKKSQVPISWTLTYKIMRGVTTSDNYSYNKQQTQPFFKDKCKICYFSNI